MVDVVNCIHINRPRAAVSEFSAEPDRATQWYVNIKAAEWKTPRPLQVGSRIAFIAHFLGRRLEYTYEVTDLVPGERLVMRTTQGPFPMETTYQWQDASDGGTCMSLRNRGVPSGFTKLIAPFVALAMKRANRNDLKQLKRILERDGQR